MIEGYNRFAGKEFDENHRLFHSYTTIVVKPELMETQRYLNFTNIITTKKTKTRNLFVYNKQINIFHICGIYKLQND